MIRICLMNVWIGKFPNTFPLFLKSASINSTIDFYIISDQDSLWNIPNVHFIKMTLKDIKICFEHELKMRIKLEYPYKLCDYKPIWRMLIMDVLEKYDFWGHLDLDIILGDIRAFLTDELLSKHDKLFDSGFFGLYRCNEEMNDFYKLSMNKDNMAYPYKRVFRTNYACYFDEFFGMTILGWKYKDVFRDQQTEDVIQNFGWKNFYFTSYITHERFIFQWVEGKLYRFNTNEYGEIIEEENKFKEYMLVHIGKRDMKLDIIISDINAIQSFWIYPNNFSADKPLGPLYDDQICKQYADIIHKQDKMRRINNFKRYGLFDYIPHFIISRKILKYLKNIMKFY